MMSISVGTSLRPCITVLVISSSSARLMTKTLCQGKPLASPTASTMLNNSRTLDKRKGLVLSFV